MLFEKYGFYEEGFGFIYDSLPLLGIPCAMITLTLVLGLAAKRERLSKSHIVVSSVVAALSAIWWLSIWGQGV